jgi:hypothetical protein
MNNPVAPVSGHYARMRDGAVVGPIRNASAWYTNSTDKWGCWHTDFLWDNTGRLSGKAYDPDLDIIATISPEAMKLAANPELIADLIREAFDTSPAYTSLKGTIEKMLAELERLRTANEKMKATMQEVRLIAVDAQLRATYQRTALESISAKLRTALEGGTV